MNQLLFVTFFFTFFNCCHSFCLGNNVAENLYNAKVGFEQRWHDFCDTMNFPLWKPDWKEEDLKARFDQMMKDRWMEYFVNPEDFNKEEDFGKVGFSGSWKEKYQKPKDWESWFSRYPTPLPLLYNLASPLYNASIINLHGKHFLAMEAPCEKNLKTFMQILHDYQVTDLVRLTPAYDEDGESCFPYWSGNTSLCPGHNGLLLDIGDRKINYFFTNCWKNHQGIEPNELLALVKTVMKTNETDNKMIGVHCRAGFGRTGVFITAYALLDDIDRQIAASIDFDHLEVSIDKVIWELSLQRTFSVCHFPQYLTLYQLVNHYVNTLKSSGVSVAPF